MSGSGTPLLHEEWDVEVADEKHWSRRREPTRPSSKLSALYLIIGTVFLAASTYFYAFPHSHNDRTMCSDPAIRSEWRSLSPKQQESYLSAVSCLRDKPSRLGLKNQSLYHDFPYVHFRVGGYSHHSAAFIAWHRYFIHIYEKALREDCGYDGNLTYWDWSLDWHNITNAPIWSPSSFGTNGSSDSSEEVYRGGCVSDGRFNHTKVLFLDEVSQEHCLSRGFVDGAELIGNGSLVSPPELEKVLSSSTYHEFNIGLEKTAHDAIPRIIRGDFSLLTAPSDPVFFLHHTQLDRLWRLWQERNWEHNGWQYNGRAKHMSKEEASLDDIIPMGGLAPDVRVRDIMDTRSGMLCYT